MSLITVAKDASGDFPTIQEAIDSVRVHPLDPVTILIKSGHYHERIFIPENKPTLTLMGEDKEKTVITYDNHANMLDEDGKPIGTFQTPTMNILADHTRLKDLTIQNIAGRGEDVGQALALSVSGDQCYFENLHLFGYQDTLYACKGRHAFWHCTIAGDIDFIFGAAEAIFHQCTIHSLRRGYITAASTPANQRYGFIFLNCKLTGEAKPNSVYLGRPWRPYAHTLFINCWMGEHINQTGWDNWRNKRNEQTARYGEAHCKGPGAISSKRVQWATEEANLAEIEHRLSCLEIEEV
ncbi:pectinesterase family protein [Alkalihalobacillus hemicellulosilyticus]|uniref:Pectinesterase n=1 Tax=Halalkalibacter hemicellulosilyticusJCM 9152 TaxID=1236971 RepID=W4QBI5_9BACI|nr:pectinesterase family protein [Halalkalibacter hemicellulosilyticus]GAE28759.1 rhamnogalacturonan acetylesterase [Halalkalibacter hemicellulosilyticusJCM 9152]